MAADDAYIRVEGNRWTLGTALMERTVALEDGKLLLKSLKNKATGHELISSGVPSEEFFLRIGDAKQPITGSTGPWKLIRADQTKLGQGELQLDLALQRESLLVTKSYLIYPGSSIVRQWITVKNAGSQPITVVEPGFLAETVRPGEPDKLDFHWMTGGENQPGSWVLKTEKLGTKKPRTFDSYEPFPVAAPAFPGDGVNVKILLNGKQVWPATGVQHVANATVKAPVDFQANVAAGDKLAFIVNMNGNIGWDTTAFDPTLQYDDGESHTASREFSDKQGQNGWRYQYIEGQQYVDLTYYAGSKQWRKTKDNATGTPFVGVGDQHPDAGQDAARVWTAPKAGRVHVTATACNTGNQSSSGPGGYGFRMASGTYAPWNAMLASDTGDGVVIGWGLFRPLGVVVPPQRRRQCYGRAQNSGPQAITHSRRVAYDAQGVRRLVPQGFGRSRQRSPRLAVPLSLGLYTRQVVPSDSGAGLLDEGHRVGANRDSTSVGSAASPTWTVHSVRCFARPT